jgi:NADH-quinone oxidoreductase subunit H
LFSKEEFEPNTPNKFLFYTGPAIAIGTALMTSAVIPWEINFIYLARILFYKYQILIMLCVHFAILSIGIYGIMIGGWASNNKFSLMGAVRAASQMVSYEVAMGLSIIALLMMTGTLSLREIAAQQSGMHWNVFYQPLSFFIF